MRHICCVLLFFLFVCIEAFSQTALQTSFENAQGYNAGNIHGLNQWTVSAGAASVINTAAKTGSQSLKIFCSNTALKIDHVAYAGNFPGITGEVYADMWVNPASLSTRSFGINGYDLYGASSRRIFVIEFTTAGQIRAFNGASSSSSIVGSWTSGEWVRVSVKVDFAAEKYKVAINGNVYATDLSFRESYTPTASGTRVATTKEYHSLRFNHLTDTDVSSTDVTVDDIYIGTTPISDVSFGASSTTRTITVTQPPYGNITLNPANGPYNLGQSVTATLTLPQGYINNGWTGDLSGTSLVNTFTVAGNMSFNANVGIDPVNPPPTYTITVIPPANGSITLSPASANNVYYKEAQVTATISYEACYQFNSWTGDLSGNQAIKTFTVQGNMTISADITENVTPSTVRTVSTVTEFKNALAAMNPGDVIEVNNGSYNLGSLTINRSGCAAKPIIIAAKNKGQAILNGATALLLRNMSYVTLKGFMFQSVNISTGVKLENCSRIRITQNVFNYTENASCTWLYIGDTYASPEPLRSGHNKIDHNIFDGKTQPGNYIKLDGNIDSQTRYDTIEYNHFKNNGPRAANEKESIRVGVSTLSMSSGYTLIQYNLFENCDGDPEIISIKSCDNTIRYNTFISSLGTLSLRHGFRSTVEGNYFFGNGKTALYNGNTIGCGGIRVYGKDHKIINNYFHGLTGEKWDAAITITNGNVANNSTSLTEHFLPENVVVAFNTLVNNKSNIEIGFDNNGNYNRAPINCIIGNNIVMDNANPIVKSYSNTSLAGVSFQNNIFYPTQTSSIGIAATAAQINNIDPRLIQPSCQGALCSSMRAYEVYRLDPLSPAVDAATGTYNYVSADFEGYQRTGAKDIGAHEYRGNSTVTITALDEGNIGPDAVNLSYEYQYPTLPVRLLDFTASLENGNVVLEWKVSDEVDFSHYEVEWGTNGNVFQKLLLVNATGGVSYRIPHGNPATGKNYYRLKMIDKDGKYKYSAIRSLDFMRLSAATVYPNPAKHQVRIELKGEVGRVNIRLINSLGFVIKNMSGIAGDNITIPIVELASGTYQVQIITNGNIIHTKTLQVLK